MLTRPLALPFTIAALLSLGCGSGSDTGNAPVAGRGGGTSSAGHGGAGGGGGAVAGGAGRGGGAVAGGAGGGGGGSAGTAGGTAAAGAGAGGSAAGGGGTAAGAGGTAGTSSAAGAGGRGGGAVAGKGGSSAAGTTGAAGSAGSAGAAGGGSSQSGAFLDFLDHSAGMTIAIDATGAIHVAAAVLVSQGYSVVYGRCAGQCATAASWALIPLPVESDTSHVPTIALTADGRPRILYASELGAAPGFHYLECDAACSQVASWHDVRLTMSFPIPDPAPRPSMPFAVSPGGAAAFAYDDGFGLHAWVCQASCGTGTSWKSVTLAGYYVYAEAVAFSSDQSLQVLARHATMNDESLVWFDCNSADCSTAASWAGLDGLWVVHGQLRAALARTAAGGTRIVFYGDDPGTAAVENVFGYRICDSDCRTATSWQQPLLLPITPGVGNDGFDLALDAAGQPTLAFLNDTASGLARCTGACAGTSGMWQVAAGADVSYLNTAFAPTVPASCLSASWGMYIGPSLALAANGNPALALTAHVKAFGGQCGTGSAATITSSFLSLP